MSISFYAPPGMTGDEPRRNRAIADSGILDVGSSLAVQNILWAATRVMGTHMAAVTVIHGNRQTLVAAAGLDHTVSARSTSFCGHAILQPENVMVVADASTDERFAGNPNVIGEPHIRFYAGAPLIAPDGEAVGTLCVFDHEPRSGMPHAAAAELRALAGRVMAASIRLKTAELASPA